MNGNRWTAALFALLLFGCGVLAGALGHRYYTATAVSAKSADDFRHHYIAEMESRLKLTPAQVTQLGTILDDTKAKFHAVREQYRPAMLKIKEEQIARVKSILTPEQIPAYDQLIAERERRAHDQEERESRHGR
jgi:Spy/CpxP family protein refolding chaperone